MGKNVRKPQGGRFDSHCRYLTAQPLMLLFALFVCDPLTWIISLLLAADLAHMAVELFVMLAWQSETCCQMKLEILTVLLAVNDSWKQFFSAFTSVISTLEVFQQDALYKSAFCLRHWSCHWMSCHNLRFNFTYLLTYTSLCESTSFEPLFEPFCMKVCCRDLWGFEIRFESAVLIRIDLKMMGFKNVSIGRACHFSS